MNLKLWGGALVFTLALGVPSAHAELMFTFTNSADVPTSAFSINTVGQTVGIKIYLTENSAPGVLDNGLSSISFTLTSSLPGVAAVLAEGDVTVNPEFDIPAGVSVLPGSLTIDLTSFLGVSPVVNGVNLQSIYLATVTYTATGVGTTNLLASDLGNTYTVFDVDPFDVTSGSGSITVLNDAPVNPPGTEVPEPGSLLLFGTVMGLGWAARRLRRKPQLPTT
jgi:hypothetical protein